jgi:hypothetical protein
MGVALKSGSRAPRRNLGFPRGLGELPDAQPPPCSARLGLNKAEGRALQVHAACGRKFAARPLRHPGLRSSSSDPLPAGASLRLRLGWTRLPSFALPPPFPARGRGSGRAQSALGSNSRSQSARSPRWHRARLRPGGSAHPPRPPAPPARPRRGARGRAEPAEPSRAEPSRGRRAREASALSPGELARAAPGSGVGGDPVVATPGALVLSLPGRGVHRPDCRQSPGAGRGFPPPRGPHVRRPTPRHVEGCGPPAPLLPRPPSAPGLGGRRGWAAVGRRQGRTWSLVPRSPGRWRSGILEAAQATPSRLTGGEPAAGGVRGLGASPTAAAGWAGANPGPGDRDTRWQDPRPALEGTSVRFDHPTSALLGARTSQAGLVLLT